MFDNFLNYFNEKTKIVYSDNLYSDFITQLGGKQFGEGLFNSFSDENVDKWSEIVSDAYPEVENKFKLFGYDWLGRCFGIELCNGKYGKILMFEIGTADILQIPCSFEEFLNNEIPSNAEACLAELFFREWMEFSKTKIEYGRCIGYDIPLFLGGEDEISNLEDTDMEVYWGVLGQLRNSVDDYDDGTEFGDFTIQ